MKASDALSARPAPAIPADNRRYHAGHAARLFHEASR